MKITKKYYIIRIDYSEDENILKKNPDLNPERDCLFFSNFIAEDNYNCFFSDYVADAMKFEYMDVAMAIIFFLYEKEKDGYYSVLDIEEKNTSSKPIYNVLGEYPISPNNEIYNMDTQKQILLKDVPNVRVYKKELINEED